MSAEILRWAADAIRDLLDKEAEGVESGNWRPCVDPALTVARSYLGSDK